MTKNHMWKRFISAILLCSLILSVCVSAETIGDGKAKTVTINMDEKF